MINSCLYLLAYKNIMNDIIILIKIKKIPKFLIRNESLKFE